MFHYFFAFVGFFVLSVNCKSTIKNSNTLNPSSSTTTPSNNDQNNENNVLYVQNHYSLQDNDSLFFVEQLEKIVVKTDEIIEETRVYATKERANLDEITPEIKSGKEIKPEAIEKPPIIKDITLEGSEDGLRALQSDISKEAGICEGICPLSIKDFDAKATSIKSLSAAHSQDGVSFLISSGEIFAKSKKTTLGSSFHLEEEGNHFLAMPIAKNEGERNIYQAIKIKTPPEGFKKVVYETSNGTKTELEVPVFASEARPFFDDSSLTTMQRIGGGMEGDVYLIEGRILKIAKEVPDPLYQIGEIQSSLIASREGFAPTVHAMWYQDGKFYTLMDKAQGVELGKQWNQILENQTLAEKFQNKVIKIVEKMSKSGVLDTDANEGNWMIKLASDDLNVQRIDFGRGSYSEQLNFAIAMKKNLENLMKKSGFIDNKEKLSLLTSELKKWQKAAEDEMKKLYAPKKS